MHGGRRNDWPLRGVGREQIVEGEVGVGRAGVLLDLRGHGARHHRNVHGRDGLGAGRSWR